jgi:hypothetical protein
MCKKLGSPPHKVEERIVVSAGIGKGVKSMS